MAKYITYLDAKDSFIQHHYISINLKDWAKNQGIDSSQVSNYSIYINDTDKSIICTTELSLNYSGPRMRSTFLHHDLAIIAQAVKFKKKLTEFAEQRAKEYLVQKWSQHIWNSIWKWMKPRLDQETLRAHYIIPTTNRRGANGYNFLLRNPSIRENLITGSRFLGFMIYEQWLSSWQHHEYTRKTWDQIDIEWSMNAAPETLVPLDQYKILSAAPDVKMPANWRVQPQEVLKTIDLAIQAGAPTTPLKNTRILQACNTMRYTSPGLATSFLFDWKDSWSVMKQVLQEPAFKTRLPLAYQRMNQIAMWTEKARISGVARRFNDYLQEALREQRQDTFISIMDSGAHYTNADYPTGTTRVHGKSTKLLLIKIDKGAIKSILDSFDSWPLSLPLGPRDQAYSLSVNGKIVGIAFFYPGCEYSNKFHINTIGPGNTTMSKHWYSRALSMWNYIDPGRAGRTTLPTRTRCPARIRSSAKPSRRRVATIMDDIEF